MRHALLLVAACGSSTSSPAPDAATGERTLETCETSIDASVPAPCGVEAYGILCDGTLVFGCTELDGSPPDHVHLCPSWPDHARPYTPEIQFYSTCNVN